MAYGEKEMTEHEEHLISIEVVRFLLEKGVSFGRASRILDEAKEEMKKVPLTEW